MMKGKANPAVSVYGILCNTSIVRPTTITETIIGDIKNLQEGAVIRIISGEANCNVYDPCEDAFRKAHKDKNVKCELILGPVVSGCRDKGKLKNSMLNLAEEGMVDIYLARVRRMLHMRIMGNQLIHGEMPHAPVSGKRLGYTLDVNDYPSKDQKRVVTAIAKRINEFESMKFLCEHIPQSRIDEDLLVLTNSDIRKADKKAKELGLTFNLLRKEHISRLLQAQ